jgi:uncharacterized Rmd1/YagE family protein
MSDEEYFELKYLEEIYQLFRECQEISKFNNLDLLLHKDDNFMDLFDLLLDSVELTNEMDDSEIEELDEY